MVIHMCLNLVTEIQMNSYVFDEEDVLLLPYALKSCLKTIGRLKNKIVS